ncbi:hypothetical protein E4U56_005582 [Claviceps arundinis]|uniref:WLM domain-containing protein n=1 Tax=Claviceps arundinis TaxID=1623583 RepID=A0A9P7MYJ6_9HYPO|nr:hypothetical protein E4U56_005582 [Claviceps arundinis]
MPIGIQRLNAKRSQPNPNIIFIKPLPGPNEKTSQAFLERIAAQCLPIMRTHHLSIMTLEEHEPNPEFLGRNFNAGEVIQLVLRSGRSGRWLPFQYVQMVMMHELAHCKQMNHSRAFWAVRNQYAAQMEDLWRDGYIGDGIWGRGANLGTGAWERNVVQSREEMLPGHLCGGTYRTRRGGRRKRTGTVQLSYQERKQRRILKKFGENGVPLGADEQVKGELEKGRKKTGARPRVAGSARGRELRAAAALARFEQQKVVEEEEEEEHGEVKKEEEMEDSGSDDEYETGSGLDEGDEEEGPRLLDRKGRRLVKVCEENGDVGDTDARNELSQLQDMLNQTTPGTTAHGDRTSRSRISPIGIKNELRTPSMNIKDEPRDSPVGITDEPHTPPTGIRNEPQTPHIRIKNEPLDDTDVDFSTTSLLPTSKPPAEFFPQTGSSPPPPSSDSPSRSQSPPIKSNSNSNNNNDDEPLSNPHTTASSVTTCMICSLKNDAVGATCSACGHVLDADLTPDTWRCEASGCRGSRYVNSGDYGVCGLCGRRRRGG